MGGPSGAKPVSVRYGSGHGSVYQRFLGAAGRGRALYSSAATGTHPVTYGEAIGDRFAAGGYAGTYGAPVDDVASLADGGSFQLFSAGGRKTKIIFSAATGAKVVKEYTAIGRQWAALDYQRGLGYPTTDEHRTPTGSFQEFTDGRIGLDSRTGKTTVTRT